MAFAVIFHSPFEIVDLVIIGVFLVPGIVRKVSGMRAYKELELELADVSEEELCADIARLGPEISRLNGEIAEKNAILNQLQEYCGKYWVVSKTASAPAYAVEVNAYSTNTEKLEEDFCELVECIADDKGKSLSIESWLSIMIIQNTSAVAGRDQLVLDKFDSMFNLLQKQKRWPLVLMHAMISAATVTILSRVWGMDQEISLAEGMETLIHTTQIPEQYRELYDNAEKAFGYIVTGIVREMKKYS